MQNKWIAKTLSDSIITSSQNAEYILCTIFTGCGIEGAPKCKDDWPNSKLMVMLKSSITFAIYPLAVCMRCNWTGWICNSHKVERDKIISNEFKHDLSRRIYNFAKDPKCMHETKFLVWFFLLSSDSLCIVLIPSVIRTENEWKSFAAPKYPKIAIRKWNKRTKL